LSLWDLGQKFLSDRRAPEEDGVSTVLRLRPDGRCVKWIIKIDLIV